MGLSSVLKSLKRVPGKAGKKIPGSGRVVSKLPGANAYGYAAVGLVALFVLAEFVVFPVVM